MFDYYEDASSLIDGDYFTPDEKGTYKLVYSVYDSNGNKGIKEITIPVTDKEVFNIESNLNDTYCVGEKFIIEDFNVDCYTTITNSKIVYYFNNKKVDLSTYEYISFEEEGKLKIAYEFTCFGGKVKKGEKIVNIVLSNNPIIDVEEINEYIASGKTLYLPKFTATDYSKDESSSEYHPDKYYLVNGQKVEYSVGSYVVNEKAGSTINIKMVSKETVKEINVKVVDPKYLSDYFTYTSTSEATNGSSYLEYTFTETNTFTYINPLIANTSSGLSIGLGLDLDLNRENYFDVYVEDLQNPNEKIFVRIFLVNGEYYLQINARGDKYPAKTATKGGNSYINLIVNNITCMISGVCKIKEYANGTTFNGFSSSLLKLSIVFEEVSSKTGELQSYILEATGVEIPIIDDSSLVLGGKYISIGTTSIFKEQNIDVSNLNMDGFVIKTIDNSLYICGQRVRGTLYGVYDFLEKILDVHFMTISYEYIPTLSKIEVPSLDIVDIPTFRMRGDYYEAVKNDLFYGTKMRYITPTQSKSADVVGGAFHDDWMCDFESMNIIVPFNETYAKHPDWYSGSDSRYSQPCLSNGLNDDGTLDETMEESYLKETIKNIEAYILENPDTIYYPIGQIDNTYVCTCDKCTRQVKKFGTRSGQIVAFVNAVSREVDKWMEENNIDLGHEIYFSTYAYSYSVTPPVYQDDEGVYHAYDEAVIPEDNVCIQFAPIGACYLHALNDPCCSQNINETYVQFAGWSSICDNFYIFDYNVNFNDFLTWHPSMGVMKENLLYYEEIGVDGVFTEGAASQAYNYYQQDLMSWVYSKLLWNPHRDVNELISEFNRYYFDDEEIGKILDEYVAFMNAHYVEVSETQSNNVLHAQTFSNSSPWLISSETLSKAFIEKAESYLTKIRNILDKKVLTDQQKEDFEHNFISVNIQLEYMKFLNYDTVFYTTEAEKTAFLTKLFDDAGKMKLDLTLRLMQVEMVMNMLMVKETLE